LKAFKIKNDYVVFVPQCSGSSFAFAKSHDYTHIDLVYEGGDIKNLLSFSNSVEHLPFYGCIRKPFTRILSYFNRFCIDKEFNFLDTSFPKATTWTLNTVNDFFEHIKIYNESICENHITFQSKLYSILSSRNIKYFDMPELCKYLLIEEDVVINAFGLRNFGSTPAENHYQFNGDVLPSKEILDAVTKKAIEFTKKEDRWYKKMLTQIF